MKNLKQVLALGMAFSLTMSTMAGAAFTDQDSINKVNADAVQLLTALDVIQGNPDGSFAPEKTVTRAEMAKMIYTIRNGGNDNADAYKSVSTTFTDISGHWAEGYIKYLQSTGIIAGKSATIFDPDATVTTAEAMKMALVLGGYRSDKANLEGATWLNNTVSLATTNQLTKDVASSMDGGCTRQDAAQILANALEMTAVQWSEFTQSFLNDSNEGLALGGNPITVGNKWMNLNTEVGFLTQVPSAQSNPKGISFIYDSNRDGNINGSDKTVTFKNVTKDVSDLMGYEVKVVWNGGDLSASDAVYGIYKTDNNTSYETTWKDVSADGAKVKFDGKSYNLSGADTNWDGTVDASNAVVAYRDAQWNDSALKSMDAGDFDGKALADTVTFIDNDNDGKLDAVQIKTKTVAEVTYVGSKSITTKALVGGQNIWGNDGSNTKNYDTTPELTEVNTYEGIAKDDFAVVSYDVYSDKVTYEKAEVKTGTVEATRTKNNTLEVKIDGNWMKATEGYDGVKKLAAAAGDTVEYVAIDNLIYNIKKTDGTWGSNSIAMIYNAAVGTGEFDSDKVMAQIIKRDGSTEKVQVGKIDGTEIDNTLLATVTGKVGVPMTYRVVGGKYEFKTFASASASVPNTAGFDDMRTTSSPYFEGQKVYGNAEIADDAIVFMFDDSGDGDKADTDNSAKVISGAELKKTTLKAGSFATVNANDQYLVSETNGFNYVYCMSVAIDLDDAVVTGRNYGYLLSDAWEAKGADGKWYRAFSLWTEAGEITAYQETGNEFEYKSGTIITYEVSSTKDGITYIKSVDVPELTLGKVTAVDGNYVGLDGTKGELVNDSVVLNVNTDDQSGISGGADARGQIAEADLSVDGNANVRYVMDGNKNIIFMLIDTVNNEIMSGENRNLSESALRAILNDAKSGDTVVITGNVPAGTFTIPAGVIVDLSNATITGATTFVPTTVGASLVPVTNWSVTVSGTLTINSGATLTASHVKFNDDATASIEGKFVAKGLANVDDGDITFVGSGSATVGSDEFDSSNDDIYTNGKDTAKTKVVL